MTQDFTLPIMPPAIRIYTRKKAQDGWTERATHTSARSKTNPRQPIPAGYYFDRNSEASFPSLGSADFHFELGSLGPSDDIVNFQTGSLPDLLYHQVRIDFGIMPATGAPFLGEPTEYITGFWGIIEAQNDELDPGSEFSTLDDVEVGFVSAGRRTFRAYDLTTIWRHRYVAWHAFEPSAGATRTPCRGAVPFNTSIGAPLQAPDSYSNRGSTKIAGPNGQMCYPHATAVAGSDIWTDLDVAEQIIAMNSQGEDVGAGLVDIQITVTDDHNMLDGINVWDFPEGMPVREALSRIFDRRRARGHAKLTWTNTDAGPTNPTITLTPQTLDDIPYGATSQDGATTAGTDIAITLTGDSRVVDGAYVLGGTSAFTVDYIETVGEQIEVLVSLSYEDATLEKRWSDANATLVDDSDDVSEAEQVTLAHVYRLHGFPADWDGGAGNGNGDGQNYRIDYICDDDGTILQPDQDSVVDQFFSPVGVEFMPDCPCYTGYDPKTGSATSDTDAGKQLSRFRNQVFSRTGDDEFVHVGDAASVIPQQNTLIISDGADNGKNRFGSPSGEFDYTTLVVCCGMRIKNRLRMATGDPAGLRKLQVYEPGAHLWIGHIDSMVGIADDGTGNKIGGSPIIYRNDIARIQRQHALTEAWYMRERRSLTYAMYDCGFQARDQRTTDTVWPSVGQVVSTANVSGETVTIATPITFKEYDHNAGVTSWRTDWVELG